MALTVHDILKPAGSDIPEIGDEPAWLKEYRRRALQVFRSARVEPNPLYVKYETLARFDAPDAAVAEPPARKDNVPEELADLVSSGTFMLQSGGAFHMASNLPKGAIFEEMRDAVSKHGDMLKDAFDRKGLRPKDDVYVALNSAMFSTGYFLRVPDGIALESPVHILDIEDVPGAARFSQNIVQLGDNSAATVIEEILSPENFTEKSLFSGVTDVLLGRNAELHHASLENLSSAAVYLSSKRCLASGDSRMHWVSNMMGSDVTRSRADTRFVGRGASTDDYEILFGNGKQRFDVVTDLHHDAESTNGRITVRSVLKGHSRALLRGMIRIGENAANTNSYLAEHGMLMSKDARCDAIPGLEILTNGVKATHSASVSQLDDQQLYYVQSRGLDRDEAEKMLVLGFFDPVISRVPLDTVRDKLRFQIEDKWNNVVSLRASRHLDEIEFEKYVKDQIKEPGESIFEGHYKYR